MGSGKILVIGRGEAGKSTLISALARDATNLAVRGRTVAMDHATLRRGGAVLHLVGAPGQSRFAAVREALSRRAHGVIWVHPAWDTEPHRETVALLAGLTKTGARYLVCVNQQSDRPSYELIHPRGLPAPESTFYGNLVKGERDFIARLVEEIWRLLPEAGPGTRRGARPGTVDRSNNPCS